MSCNRGSMGIDFGRVGFLSGSSERVILWRVDYEHVFHILEEIKMFVPGIKFADWNVDNLNYLFDGSDKVHTLNFPSFWFCFTFSTGRLSKVSEIDVYQNFFSAF